MEPTSNTEYMTANSWSSQQKGKYHGRGRPEGHIPRPPNAFMLFRSAFLRDFPPSVTQQDKSRMAGMCWRQLSPTEVAKWTEHAKEIKEDHYRQYPDFKYKPTPKGPVKRRRQARTREQQLQDCETLLKKYMPDKAGPIPQSSTSVPRRGKRKTGHKSNLSPQPSPHDTQEMVPSCSTAPQREQVFTDPLIRPPPASAQAASSLSPDCAQQAEEPWTLDSSILFPDPVLHPFLFDDTSAPPSEDWSRRCSQSALKPTIDALEQRAEPPFPQHLFEGTRVHPSGVPPHDFTQHGHTYTLPPVSTQHAYPLTFEWQMGVNQSHPQPVIPHIIESSEQSAGVPHPPPPHVLEPVPVSMCYNFGYGSPSTGCQHLVDSDRTVRMRVAPEQELGQLARALDMGTDIDHVGPIGVDMSMGMGMSKERMDLGMGIEFGMGMGMGIGDSNAYHAAAATTAETEWIVSAPVCDLVQVNNTPTS